MSQLCIMVPILYLKRRHGFFEVEVNGLPIVL